MLPRGEQLLLRTVLPSTLQHHLAPAYERIVEAAAARRLAGATVVPGLCGYLGADRIEPSAWTLAQRTPVVVEIVDAPARLTPFVTEVLSAVMHEGLATLERAAVLRHQPPGTPATPPPLTLHPPIAPLSTLPQADSGESMDTAYDGLLLRVFLSDTDRVPSTAVAPIGEPLYRAILAQARALKLRAAIVLPGTLGYGSHAVLHSAKTETRATPQPLVLELVDTREKIEQLLPVLEGLVTEGLVTMEDVRIVLDRQGR